MYTWNVSFMFYRLSAYIKSQFTISDAISPPWVPFVDATVVARVLEAGGIVHRETYFSFRCKSSLPTRRLLEKHPRSLCANPRRPSPRVPVRSTIRTHTDAPAAAAAQDALRSLRMDLATWPSVLTKAALSACPAHSAASSASNQRMCTRCWPIFIRQQWLTHF